MTALDLKSEEAKNIAAQSLPRLARVARFQVSHGVDVSTSDGTVLSDFMKVLPTKDNMSNFHAELTQCYDMCRNATMGMDHGVQARIGCEIGCGDWRLMRLRYLTRLDATFPWTATDKQRGIALISLMSITTNTDTVGQNAIGFVDDGQLARLRDKLASIPTDIKTIVVTLHHPLFIANSAFPDLSVSDLLEWRHTIRRLYSSDWFMSIFLDNNAVQATKVYELLRDASEKRHGAEVVFLYGHRHKRSLSRMGKILLVEAPNVGTTNPDDFGFYVISRNDNGTVAAHWCRGEN